MRILSDAASSGVISDEHLAVGIAAILVVGIAAQWLAWRLRLPAILLLLAAGMIAGPAWQGVFGHKLLDPDQLLGGLVAPIVSLSVAIILFEGGLTLNLSDLRHSGQVVWRLVTLGAAITFTLAATAGVLILRLPPGLAILLGAILIVTGPTVIGPMLRFIRPTGPVGAVLKWEGIVIDPIGAVLALLVFELLRATGNTSAIGVAVAALLKTSLAGAGLGIAAAALLIVTLKRFWIADQLQVPATLMLVIVAFTGANLIQGESGLLAVTVMGIALANQRYVAIAHILEFKETLSVLLVGTLFVILGSRLDVSQVAAVGVRTALFAATLILIVRPLSVWASTLGTGLAFESKAFLAWMAPRGIVAAAVTSVFSLRLREQGIEHADALLPTTFAVIVATVCVYGLSASWAARRLGLADPNNRGFLIAGANRVARAIASALVDAGQEVLLVDTNRDNIAAARMAGLPVFSGNILSDQLLRRIDGTGIGRLLALTPSHDVNALAVLHFSRHFGRSQVFQLPAEPAEEVSAADKSKSDVSHELRGRTMFSPTLYFEALRERLRTGSIKRTQLTEAFGFDRLAERHAGALEPLFVVDATGQLHVRTAEDSTTPRAGQSVITLVPRAVPT